MKTITHDSSHPDLELSKIQAVPRPDCEESTVWTMIAILVALIAVFAYLFWNKL